MIVDRVLQYSSENQGQFGRWAVGVVDRQLHHRILDDIQCRVVVTHGKRGLLESTPLDAGQEVVEFLFGCHDKGTRSAPQGAAAGDSPAQVARMLASGI